MKMTLQGLASLRQRIRGTMPVHLQFRDPYTGQETVISRDDVLNDLIVNGQDLLADAQLLPAQYAEFARAHRACEYATAHAEHDYAAWKAAMAKEAAAKHSGSKGITVAEAERYYRTHPDYAAKSSEAGRWQLYAGIFIDLKEAVKLKAQVMNGQLRNVLDAENVGRPGF